jgi:hypothetical protein
MPMMIRARGLESGHARELPYPMKQGPWSFSADGRLLLIVRAVAGLTDNTYEGRQALYERARAALLTNLRGVTPPLSEADIVFQRLALEEAIRQVETETARAASYSAEALGRIKPPIFPTAKKPSADS